MSALVSFERVFEILDLEPLIRRAGRPQPLPDGPVSRGVRRRPLRLPVRGQGVAGLAGGRRAARRPRRRRRCCTTSRFRVEPGQMVALVGSSGAGKSTIAQLLPRLYDVDSGAVRLGGVDVRDLTFDSIRDTLGLVTQDGHLFHESIRGQPAAGPARRRPRTSCGTCCGGPGWTALVAGAARRAGHRGRRARLPALRRRAAAADDRPAAARPAARRHPRRGHRAPGLDVRGRRAGGAGRGAGGAHRGGDRPPALHDPRRRPDPRGRGRADRRARHAPRAAGRGTAGTRSCTARSSTTRSTRRATPPSLSPDEGRGGRRSVWP